MSVEIDFMETLTSDALAQAAYVISDTGYSADLTTPAMTSNTAPSPFETSASTKIDSDYAAWKAFSHVNATHTDSWTATALPAWIKFDFGVTKIITKYTIASRDWSDYGVRTPKTWTFQGSNNDSDWDTLDTQASETGWGRAETRSYTFNNSTPYRYYKINITATGGGNPSIGEVELMKANLQSYSESTIKTQGSYSLKGIAVATDSLNDTLTRTISSPIDLSDQDLIKMDIRASRTGSNIRVGFWNEDSINIKSPISHWKCNDDTTNTTIVDSSSAGNDGALGGGDNTDDISQDPGKISKSLLLNGVDDFLNLDAVISDISSSTEGAICSWVKPTDVTSDWKTIFIFGDTNANEYIGMYQADTNGKVYVACYKAGTLQWNAYSTDVVISDDTWTHLILRHNGTTPSLYVNGGSSGLALSGETDLTAWFSDCTGIDNCRVGCSNVNSGGNTAFWGGEVDDIRVYDYALNQLEISAIYNSGSGTESDKESITHTANIASANVFQTEDIDISGVANADKDAIDSIIVTITNADA